MGDFGTRPNVLQPLSLYIPLPAQHGPTRPDDGCYPYSPPSPLSSPFPPEPISALPTPHPEGIVSLSLTRQNTPHFPFHLPSKIFRPLTNPPWFLHRSGSPVPLRKLHARQRPHPAHQSPRLDRQRHRRPLFRRTASTSKKCARPAGDNGDVRGAVRAALAGGRF